MNTQDTCPICNGTGKFTLPVTKQMKLDTVEIKREIVIRLHEKGYSLRQICKAVGYNSTRSPFLIIKEHTKGDIKNNDKPDGVHTFEQMNQLALEWKKKYYDTLELLQNKNQTL